MNGCVGEWRYRLVDFFNKLTLSKGEKSLCTNKWADRIQMNRRMCKQPVGERASSWVCVLSSLGQPGGRNWVSVCGCSEDLELWEVQNSNFTFINDPSMRIICSLIPLLWFDWNVPHRSHVWVLGGWFVVMLEEVGWYGVLAIVKPCFQFPGWFHLISNRHVLPPP